MKEIQAVKELSRKEETETGEEEQERNRLEPNRYMIWQQPSASRFPNRTSRSPSSATASAASTPANVPRPQPPRHHRASCAASSCQRRPPHPLNQQPWHRGCQSRLLRNGRAWLSQMVKWSSGSLEEKRNNSTKIRVNRQLRGVQQEPN